MIKLLFIFSVLASPAFTLPTSTTKNTVDYRLPKDFVPVSYVVNLSVAEATMTGDTERKFSGSVKIEVKRIEGAAEEIKLHASAKYLQISEVLVNGTVAEVNAPDNVTDILTIPVSSDGVAYELDIKFTGIHGTDMYGFYLSQYTENVDGVDTTKYLVTTQFQPTHGRRAFPMFDEPEFKATFQITINHPSQYTALSNTPGVSSNDNSLTTTVFEVTPVMSSYLIAFVVSEFTCTNSTQQIPEVTHAICSRIGTEDWRDLALVDGPKILEGLNEYTNINYNTQMSKLDQIAIPDFSAGAMENWGLVTYREAYLLWKEGESSNRQKQRISSVIAHELAHMWFGNLVTTRWWSTTFLNEGFATYFETFTTHDVHPDWEMDKQFVLEDHQVALEADSLVTAKALESEASSPSEVSGKFDTISYSKGGSVIRMVQHFLGSEIFQSGIRKYLEARKLNYSEPHMLWTNLQNVAIKRTMPAGINDIMENWVTKSGYPLIRVTSTESGIEINQSRFIFGNSSLADDTKWYVPISYTESTDENKFEVTEPKEWLKPTDESVKINSNADWIILNNQETGYYRVHYDDASREKIIKALAKDQFDGIHEINRAQLVDDVFALAKSNISGYPEAFGLVEFLENDVSYYPWYSAFNAFNFLQRRIGTTSPLGVEVKDRIIKLMGKVVASVPFNATNSTDQIYTHKQVLALTWACKLGLDECKTKAVEAFQSYKTSSTKPDPNLRSIIYCNGVRYSNDEADWDFLWEEYLKSTGAAEKTTIISALGCSENKEILQKYLELSLNTTVVRPQDASTVYSSVYTSGSETAINTAFDFLFEKHATISESYVSMNALGNIVRGIAERFTTQEQIDKLKKLIETLEEGSSFKEAATGALSTAEANFQWLETKLPELNEYFELTDENSTTTSTTTSTTSTTASPPPSTTPGSGYMIQFSINLLCVLMLANMFA